MAKLMGKVKYVVIGVTIIGVVGITLLLILTSQSVSCKLRGGDMIEAHPGGVKVCMIPDPNADETCTSAKDCMYGCIVDQSVSNDTGTCDTYGFNMQGPRFILDEDGNLIEKEFPIS